MASCDTVWTLRNAYWTLNGPGKDLHRNAVIKAVRESEVYRDLPCRCYRSDINKAIAAALMMRAQIHPHTCKPREFVRFPITFRSLVSSTTMITKGGANRPFRIADQNNIFTALSPAKSKTSPTTIEIAITA